MLLLHVKTLSWTWRFPWLPKKSYTRKTYTFWGSHDDVIKWKHFPCHWPFVREIHRSPVNSPHKGQWRGALMFSLIFAWIYGWVNNREAGDWRRHHAYYDVIVMGGSHQGLQVSTIGNTRTCQSQTLSWPIDICRPHHLQNLPPAKSSHIIMSHLLLHVFAGYKHKNNYRSKYEKNQLIPKKTDIQRSNLLDGAFC